MDYKELFQALPDLIKLFVPGFIFICILRYFRGNKAGDFEQTAVTSVIYSYIFNTTSDLICKDHSDILSIIISIIISLILVIFSRKNMCKSLLTKLGRITGSKSIWYDIFDLNLGTRVRFFTIYNHSKVMIEGNIKYYDPKPDSCDIVISKYKITYENGNVYDAAEHSANTLIYINSKDIHGLETTNGK